MSTLVYYVVRQWGGWGVEHDGFVRSGHRSQDDAIQAARTSALAAMGRGQECRLRIQDEEGGWREERSFAPVDSVA